MADPVVLVPLVSGFPLSAPDQNNNWALVEDAFSDLGPFIVNGLVLSIGTGLSVNVTSGVAVIGAHLTPASFVIGSLTSGTVNHLYLNQNLSTAHNTTGVQPAASVKLGTCLCGASTVTSVDMSPSSGRQQRGWNVGSAAGPVYGFLKYAFPADANQTLTDAQSAMEHLILSGTVTGTKTLTVTAQAGSAWWVVNGTSAGAVTLKAATGTGITVANAKSRRCLWDGVNMIAITPDL